MAKNVSKKVELVSDESASSSVQAELVSDERAEQDNASIAPDVSELAGYVTVFQAASMLNRKQSTVNYLLREHEIKGVYLGRETNEQGERASGVLLIELASLREYLAKVPEMEAQKEAARRARAELERAEIEARENIKRIQAELKAKKNALKRGR